MNPKSWQLWTSVGAIVACVALVLVWRSHAPEPMAKPAAAAVAPAAQPAAAPAPQPEPVAAAPAAAPTDEQSRIAALEALAALDYNSALAQALRETNEDRRSNLLQAVIRGWASKDIRAAGFWAKSQPYLFRDLAIAAVFNGGAKNPREAEAYARELSTSDPSHAGDYGNYLVHGLGIAGNHRDAARFSEGYSTELDKSWMIGAYSTWAKTEPRAALAAAETIADPQKQLCARQSAYSGWAQGNPEELAKIAINYPEGQERKFVLTMALRKWIGKDSAAAAEWIAKQKFSPEMEAALEE